MLSDERKRQLEDLFFLDAPPPDPLEGEEADYWAALSRRCEQALSDLYQKILRRDGGST